MRFIWYSYHFVQSISSIRSMVWGLNSTLNSILASIFELSTLRIAALQLISGDLYCDFQTLVIVYESAEKYTNCCGTYIRSKIGKWYADFLNFSRMKNVLRIFKRVICEFCDNSWNKKNYILHVILFFSIVFASFSGIGIFCALHIPMVYYTSSFIYQ